jgi:hypothetical protein
MSSKTVKEIITDYVKSVGGDGLFNPNCGCGCSLEDCCPIGEWFGDCITAKKTLCSECEEERPCEIQQEWDCEECYKRIEDCIKEKVKNQYENFKDMVLKEYDKGNIVFMTIEGPMCMPLNTFIKQPIDGILYDLNRDPEVVLAYIYDEKWVNDFAVSMVIKELKRQLDENERKEKE